MLVGLFSSTDLFNIHTVTHIQGGGLPRKRAGILKGSREQGLIYALLKGMYSSSHGHSSSLSSLRDACFSTTEESTITGRAFLAAFQADTPVDNVLLLLLLLRGWTRVHHKAENTLTSAIILIEQQFTSILAQM